MKHTLREKAPHQIILEYPDLECLEERQSPYQHIAVYRHPELGKILAHDNITMLTEAYEAAYHEMIAHIPLLHHPKPKRVLVIGGGDGGTSTQVLRHPQVEQVVQVEIDAQVVEISKKHFPKLTQSYSDPRMELHIADGIKYMQSATDFDIILVDSTDPQGPATGLFTADFYQDCHKALNPGGILVIQGETFYGMAHIQRQIIQALQKLFHESGMYLSSIPFYPPGTWSLIYASNTPRSKWQLRTEGLEQLDKQGLSYLNKDILSACFALPNYALSIFS